MYFKVLKSGFRVEACRLGHAERLARYLMVMSIVAWRLFMIALIARTEPDTPCTHFLTDGEWQVLFRKTHNHQPPPTTPPPAAAVVIWIARLGGFLARNSPLGYVTFPSVQESIYRVQDSTNLVDWTDATVAIPGDGAETQLSFSIAVPTRSFRVRLLE